MRRCLQLAAAGQGRVEPNPMVGCVIVHNDRIIGEGYHAVFGGPHAEVQAIASVGEEKILRECTLYVNLEPCAHFGKTPPCVHLILEKGIPRVVIGTLDPFRAVRGKGIELLRKAGVEVVENILEPECRFLNRRFFTFHTKGRPYILLKWAQSLDGFMDRPRSVGEKGIRWITGAQSSRRVHIQRSHEMAILVGSRTVIHDNPSLTVRNIAGRNPLRILLDPGGNIPITSHVFKPDAGTVIFSNHPRPLPGFVEQVQLESGQDSIVQVLSYLVRHNIISVLVEGGAHTLQSFLTTGNWDEAMVFTGNVTFHDGILAPSMIIEPTNLEHIGEDLLQTYFPTP